MLLELLMVLAIIGILSSMYVAPGGGSVKAGGPVASVSKAEAAACLANRSIAAVHAADYQINYGHFPSIEEMKKVGTSVPGCPAGGKFYVLDGTVYCTVHTDIEIPSPT